MDNRPQPALFEAVSAVLPNARHGVWVRLAGGRTNESWHISAITDEVVVKLYRGTSKNPVFPNDPVAEARLLRILEGSGIAPTLIAQTETSVSACNIYSHIAGQTWQSGTSQVARLMWRLHQIPPPAGLRTVSDGSAELEGHTHTILGECRFGERIAALRPVGKVAESGKQTLLHGDIVSGNLIQNAAGLQLIDWQCPAVGDPCEDVSMFLSPAMQLLYRGHPLSKKGKEAFLQTYQDQDVVRRYRNLAPWYHWRMAAYCQWKLENGYAEYKAGREVELDALQRSESA